MGEHFTEQREAEAAERPPLPPATGLHLPGAETVAIVAGILRAGELASPVRGPLAEYSEYVADAVEILTEAYAQVLLARLPDRIAERVQAAREGRRG